jgi:tetratricopeptide (TPR) repeat protein
MLSTKPGRRDLTSEGSLLASPQKQRVVGSLLLVLATVALYNPITRAPFLNLDDDLYITQNPHVQSGLTWHSAAWAFKTFANTNWHPVTWLSHELDCQLFGLNPAGPHIVNVLLHAASAVLIFLMLANITRMTGRSLMVAALFALHPINVESVAWIAERKNVLSMFFFLLALAAYGWYARHPEIRRHLVVTALYALALMAKPQVITFPFALLLLDYWPLRRIAGAGKAHGAESTGESSGVWAAARSFPSLVWEKIPWFVLSAASALITMKAQTAAKHEELAPWEHLANAALAYAKYLGKAFWPANLAPLYPHPGRTISIAAAMLSAVLIAAITVLVVIFRKRRYLFVGWFWFLGTMIPMIGLVQVGVQSMADRYAYIPLLGIFVIVCWGVPDLIRACQTPRRPTMETRLVSSQPATFERSASQWALSVGLTVMASAAVLLALAFALHRQVDYWTDNFTLWRHTLDITQNNFIAEDSAANALLAQGKTDEAMRYYRRAQQVRPMDPISALNLASYDQQRGNYASALEQYQRVLDLTNSPALLSLVQTNRGYAYFALQQDENAKQAFLAALQQQPANAPAYQGLGLLAQRSGGWTEATRDFERAIEIQPTPPAYELLAQVLDSEGKKEAAAAARAQAEQMKSGLGRAGAKGP